MTEWDFFHGPNAGYIQELYERYQADPRAVDPATRSFFERWSPPAPEPPAAPTHGAAPAATPQRDDTAKVMGAVNLAQAIREFGLLAAGLDPLGSAPPGDPSLRLEAHGLNEDDLRHLPAHIIGGPAAQGAANALEAIQRLREIYSSTTGYDYGHIRVPEEREWLRNAAEARTFRSPQQPIDGSALLERLTQVEVFERFLHRAFPGKTRFSIEGLDMMVPLIDEVIGGAVDVGIYSIIIGMAHRGRLNVLAHILEKPYAQILAEFKDPVPGRDVPIRGDLGWTGDVKYHAGAHRAIQEGTPVDLVVTMVPNPSHLEFVNPVVQGMARAAGTYAEQGGPPSFDPTVSLALVIHGDAAFPGQGVVAETLNLARLPGYHTGGTIHIIANNQIGFTTTGESSYGSLYASDLAKGFKIPIVHVNADDPEACLEAARMALAYRARFKKDFLIDLVGYRRYGHNEGDEPGFTQPLLYKKVEQHPSVRERWAATLLAQGQIEAGRAETLVQARMDELQRIIEALQLKEQRLEPQLEPPPPGAARRVKTAVRQERLRALNRALLNLPDGFALHPRLERIRQRRNSALDNVDEASIDWATAEELAFASILEDGIPIRFTGQDVGRGTFSHRHAVLHDFQSGAIYTPLQALPQARAAFEIHNSPLTENACIGFEYGYNVQAPARLVLWEAQYGDFINGAQVMIDQFVVSGRAKWGQTPSLVLLLPHGYEGQGPEHSSGRLERFLEQAAETNIRIANCTTAAQYFHLLRRQAALLQTDPLPLVVMTPKSLLRHRMALSSLRELAEGAWQPVIDDSSAKPEQVRRLVLCSGKVYVDIVTNEQRERTPEVAIVRLEQLYPFHPDLLRPIVERYKELDEVVWLQEEPENMGAWSFLRPRLEELIAGRWPLRYIGRPAWSSPSEGSASWHAVNQAAILERAFRVEVGARG